MSTGDIMDAMTTAQRYHGAATDKTGQPFVGHVLRVAASVAWHGDENLVIAALLHDTVEDTPMTMDAVLRFGWAVWGLVDALTRREGELYSSYIERVDAAGAGARIIKQADLKDNLDPRRCFDGCESLDRRHAQALFRLQTGRWPSDGDTLPLPAGRHS